MSYNACLSHMFFNNGPMALESFSLSVLAYDRFIAICFPLRHNTINTPARIFGILAMVWFFIFSILLFLVLILTRLSFCDSLTVNHFNCQYAAVLKSFLQ